ncbi:probable leucine-rich repeat receptor-like protein kinase At5g49770 isoform X1 [Zingiber officinale]|uniref:probable leucine-rich repeat receptor-like protein kinase At5g49770 isoform X1 n=1 Tax=Zingiber officinale TaxID=94328 RepID=UPI001C4BFA3A|nr:probable leucine-rich repeat receptor-like protein kinase At5g49770 isoform X1 [Zingiber officinale]XP_042422317.1 probable leucine-rich repeat receptor-like protein kinase At5g49770 isoform X1 [Zingiber officinale]XP_042422318.1 probable leucine-rich repeat receptor-like protein kinase At5g49770 isoform X1 [Zingiber officinale]XP_042422319.1 probable leucine-rich repeat receptor-like protein kinase At5g49770 isoform X1 [Zingiber officinale]XP_042422320.1 probable leucine-rich repeat recepto
MSRTLAAALGGAAGAMTVLGLTVMFVYYCFLRNRSISKTSETNSSDSSIQAGQNIETAELHGTQCFTLEELNLATKNFDDINLIGYGLFGQVHKGLLQNGILVAIERRSSSPSPQFIEEVHYRSSICHRNLVSLLGYCQENDMQMLIYEYIPNGSVSTRLYGSIQSSSGKLEFKHRLSIALGAAKGMVHLHSLNPPLIHMNFSTVKVLVGEDLTPKVADAGVRSLLNRVDGAASCSRMSEDDPFLDPEVYESGRFSVKSDVYSFGVFLLELVTGRDAASDKSIIHQAQNYQDGSDISIPIDSRMGSNFSPEGMSSFVRLIAWCLNSQSEERPSMRFIELELCRIHEKELSLTTIMGEGTTTVTLGSQLFTS